MFLFSPKVSSFSFKDGTLALTIGDKINITENYFEILPSTASNISYTLSSSRSTILKTEGRSVTAVSKGSATLTATLSDGKKADCSVTVSENEPRSVTVCVYGDKFQAADKTSYVDFYADFNGVTAVNKQVSWSISNDGDILDSETIAAAYPYSFLPPAAGKYSVSAEITDSDGLVYSDTADINVYEPYLSAPVFEAEGELVQEHDDYSLVSFTAGFTDAEGNPDRAVEWFINDESAGASSPDFSFTPQKAGVYNIECRIDGEVLDARKIVAGGAAVPQNLRIDYDNCYPAVYLYWDDLSQGCDYQIEVSTAASDFIGSIESPDKFVDLGPLIGAGKAQNIFNTSFKIKVKSLGGEVFDASDFSEILQTQKVDSAAKAYLSKKYYSYESENTGAKNYYLSDEDEFTDFLGYMLMWRENPRLTNGKTEIQTSDIYAGFPVSGLGQIEDIFTDSYNTLHITGSILPTISILNRDRTEIRLSISFQTDSLPSKTTVGTLKKNGVTFNGGTSFGASRPHVDYNENNTRLSLPIENSSKIPVVVETSEQLYFVAQNGYKPVPKTGSKAEELYDYAKYVLTRIITDAFTDIQKAHAIYDWVMWKVNYDYMLTGGSAYQDMTLTESVKYEAYYLEGVFSQTRPYAVCDGIAKAYALMCNMENIDCVRVAGTARGDSDWGGHAWNKVRLNGRWYIVDATWGDALMPFGGRRYESAFHQYFLLTDKQVEKDHKEDEPNNYPRTALEPYNWYDEDIRQKDGAFVDFYINAADYNSEAEQLAEYIVGQITGGADMYKRNYYTLIPDCYNVGDSLQQSTTYAAFDIKINGALASSFMKRDNTNPLVKAFAALGYTTWNNKVSFVFSHEYNDGAEEGAYVYVFVAA